MKFQNIIKRYKSTSSNDVNITPKKDLCKCLELSFFNLLYSCIDRGYKNQTAKLKTSVAGEETVEAI